MPSYCRVMSTVVKGLPGSELVGVEPLKVIPKSDSPANLDRMPPLGRFGLANITKLVVTPAIGYVIRNCFSMLATALLCE